MKKIIAVRSSPDWAGLSAKLRAKGFLDPADYLPSPLPPGFPEKVGETLELWNNTFSRDFFSVRADVAALARATWEAAKPDAIVSINEFEDWSSRHDDVPVCIFPTDDDDFFAPHLFEGVSPLKKRTVARFPSPLYTDKLFHRPVDTRFPRLTLALRRQHGLYPKKLAFLKPLVTPKECEFGLPALQCDFLCQTNNYALLGNLHAWKDQMDSVGEHVLASEALGRFKYRRRDLSDRYICLTNKHPCSISRLSVLLKDDFNGDALRKGVEDYVRSLDDFAPPQNMEWSKPYQAKMRDLFASL